MGRARRYKATRYTHRAKAKRMAAKLLPPAPALSKDTEALILNAHEALESIASSGNKMSKELAYQHRVLSRASLRLRGRDSLILKSAIEEINEACLAIDEALSHFNNRVSNIIGNRKDVVLRIRVKDGWARSKTAERHIRAAERLKSERWAAKYYGSRSVQVLKSATSIKGNWLTDLFSRQNKKPEYSAAVSDAVDLYSEMHADVYAAQTAVGKRISKISGMLASINPAVNEIAPKLMKVNLDLIDKVNADFETLLARFKEVKDFYQKVSNQASANYEQQLDAYDYYRKDAERMFAQIQAVQEGAEETVAEADDVSSEAREIQRQVQAQLETLNIAQTMNDIEKSMAQAAKVSERVEELEKNLQKQLAEVQGKINGWSSGTMPKATVDKVAAAVMDEIKKAQAKLDAAADTAADAAHTAADAQAEMNDDSKKAWKYFFR